MEDINHNITVLMKMITDRGAVLFSQESELPLTAAQCRVMMYIGNCGQEPVSQRSIERHLGISHTTVKGLLQRLEEKGFLRTAFDGADGRVKNVYMTPKSRRLKEQAHEIFSGVSERMLHGLTHGERLQLAGMLERVWNNIKH